MSHVHIYTTNQQYIIYIYIYSVYLFNQS